MSTWAITFKGQDSRKVYAKVKQNGRGFVRKPARAATLYASQVAPNAVITNLFGRHSEAVAEQQS